ncbi:MAG TPA: FAD-dependent monooxygenase [Bryobacteraceae bacterium]|jgi:2-polyprenyl-6-methoxyphenol hydroxylase-like FAD-dependent oxidoreductase
MRIVIAGGGIGGLTTAIALSKVGVDVHLYEQASEFQEAGAGIGIAENALGALDVLGLGHAMESDSIRAPQGGLRAAGGRFLISIPADEVSARIGAIAVFHRAELLNLLLKNMDPQRLHLGHRCTGVTEDHDGITVQFDNSATVRGDCLIAADGLKSSIRAQIFGRSEARYAGYTAWRAVVPFAGGPHLSLSETWGRGRRFGIVPMSAGRVYWFATQNAPEGQKDPVGGARQKLMQLFRGWHQPIEALIDATREESILRNDIYDIDPLPHFVQGKVALLGDAAHAMTPNLGQGACQAMEDAVVLAACLKKVGKIEPALAEYERRRVPRTREVLLRSRRLGVVAQWENPALCWLRDSVMRMTPSGAAARQMKALLDVEILTSPERAHFTA